MQKVFLGEQRRGGNSLSFFQKKKGKKKDGFAAKQAMIVQVGVHTSALRVREVLEPGLSSKLPAKLRNKVVQM